MEAVLGLKPVMYIEFERPWFVLSEDERAKGRARCCHSCCLGGHEGTARSSQRHAGIAKEAINTH